MATEKFIFKNSPSTKTLSIFLQGQFQESDGLAYIKAYNKNISAIKASEYTLELDCRNLAVTTQDLTPMLQACFESYKKDGFKKIVAILTSNQLVLKMQLNRLAGNVKLSNFQIVVK